jgi:mono/diheme cytochrome c family protein
MRKLLAILFVLSLGLFASYADDSNSKQSKETKKEAPKGDPGRGKQVFLDNCDQCHYDDSKEEKVGPGFQGIKDGRLPDGRKATHDIILELINRGPAEMPSFKDRLTEQQKEDVVSYLLTL